MNKRGSAVGQAARAEIVRREGLCPNQAEHTPSPESYLGWHAWAEMMANTHEQVRCPGCGLYSIWKPKGVPQC